MANMHAYTPLKRVLPSTSDFARFQLSSDFFESVCLNCYAVLGTSSYMKGLAILERSHRCPGSKNQKEAA